MSWKGNTINTPPNNVQKTDSVSDVRIDERRSANIRRDTDTVKNVSINLMDIDTTIFNHLDNDINPSVVGEGDTRIKVPIIYGSPERWKSANVDGVIRDYNGKIQLPVLMFKRNNVAKNESLMTLNRNLVYPVMTQYTEKNKYDKFSLLNQTVKPVNAVHLITLPDHIKITYNFMIWTELVEQMNMVIEKINFATEDYWGDKKRYRFRVYAGDYTNNIDITSGKDRMVRTEFSLTVMAYLLPESFEDKKSTHMKMLTPRKVVVTSESSSEDINTQNVTDKAVKASLVDGYVELDKEIPYLQKSVISGTEPSILPATIQTIKNSYVNLINANISQKDCNVWHTAPINSNDYGEEGWMAYDGNFHYIYVNGSWKRQPITNFTAF